MKLLRPIGSERGVAALIALLLVGMLMLLGLAALSTSEDEQTIAGNEMQEMRAFYAAEAGLERVAAVMQQEYDSTGAPPLNLPKGTENLNGCAIVFSTTDGGPASNKVLTSGSMAGLYSLSKNFTVTSTATSEVDNASVQLSQSFETNLIPIFQWAVFFEEDMWAQPRYDMNIDGRVHVNGNMYLQSSGSGESLDFSDKVTCGGDIHAGFPYGSAQNGDVTFRDGSGNQVSMKQNGNWIDSDRSDWYDTAAHLWTGQVQDQSFGQSELNLPLTGGDPHKMIERGGGNSDSYEHEASVKILDGVTYAKVGGVWQNVSATLPAGAVTTDASVEFYDAHEKKMVRNTQIDISAFKTSAYYPKNGIIYISDQRSDGDASVLSATSLVNGDDVGAPVTFACENPMYVQGDFNSTNKQPVAAISDAMTFLSNSWDPAQSKGYYGNRNASKTEVNISFITGDLEPDGTNYGGGLENLPRFLEDWNGTEFKFRGSMIEMWRSQQAAGAWRYIQASDAYYSAPARNWGFDNDLTDPNKLPPGTPTVRVFNRTGWRQSYVSMDE